MNHRVSQTWQRHRRAVPMQTELPQQAGTQTLGTTKRKRVAASTSDGHLWTETCFSNVWQRSYLAFTF